MKKMIFPVLLAGLFAVSCSKKEETKAEAPQASETEAVQQPAEEAGKVPCADCPGIETKLTLNEDGSFVLDETYLEKKDGNFTAKGSYEVSEDGSFVTVKEEGAKPEDKPRVFLITEDAAYLFEKLVDQTTKPEYKLEKAK